MSLPKRVLVAPHWYELQHDEESMNAVDLFGHCDNDNGVIRYSKKQSFSQLQETVVHELIHALLFQTELEHLFNDDQKEQLCRGLAPRILALLQQNPRLVAWLTEGVT